MATVQSSETILIPNLTTPDLSTSACARADWRNALTGSTLGGPYRGSPVSVRPGRCVCDCCAPGQCWLLTKRGAARTIKSRWHWPSFLHFHSKLKQFHLYTPFDAPKYTSLHTMSAAGVPSRPDTIYQEYRVYSIPSGSKSHYCFPESDAQLPDKLIQITNAAGTGSSRKVREIEGLYEVLRPLMQARLNKYPNEDEVDR